MNCSRGLTTTNQCTNRSCFLSRFLSTACGQSFGTCEQSCSCPQPLTAPQATPLRSLQRTIPVPNFTSPPCRNIAGRAPTCSRFSVIIYRSVGRVSLQRRWAGLSRCGWARYTMNLLPHLLPQQEALSSVWGTVQKKMARFSWTQALLAISTVVSAQTSSAGTADGVVTSATATTASGYGTATISGSKTTYPPEFTVPASADIGPNLL